VSLSELALGGFARDERGGPSDRAGPGRGGPGPFGPSQGPCLGRAGRASAPTVSRVTAFPPVAQLTTHTSSICKSTSHNCQYRQTPLGRPIQKLTTHLRKSHATTHEIINIFYSPRELNEGEQTNAFQSEATQKIPSHSSE